MKTTFIYTLEDKFGSVRYIGKSNDPQYRLRKHINESKNKRTYKEKWIYSLGGGIEINILDEVPEDEWPYWECYWISQFKQWGFNLVNGTSGGGGSDGFKGKKHTEETKQKIRESTKRRLSNVRLFGESNGKSKLTENNVREIRKFLSEGLSLRKTAKKFNVSHMTIINIKKGRRWSHVK